MKSMEIYYRWGAENKSLEAKKGRTRINMGLRPRIPLILSVESVSFFLFLTAPILSHDLGEQAACAGFWPPSYGIDRHHLQIQSPG
jgi:hypothetical protein